MKKLLEQRRVETILEAQAQSVMPTAVIERVAVPVPVPVLAAAAFAAAAAEQPVIAERANHFEKLPKKLLGGMYLEQIRERRVKPILETQVQSAMPIAVIERVAAAVFAVAEQPIIVEQAIQK